MLKEYPFYLYAEIVGQGTKDENDFVTGETSDFVFITRCDNQTSKQALERINENGVTYIPSSLIFCPKGTAPLEYGIKIEVRNHLGKVRVSGQVQEFSDDYKHCRIWL